MPDFVTGEACPPEAEKHGEAALHEGSGGTDPLYPLQDRPRTAPGRQHPHHRARRTLRPFSGWRPCRTPRMKTEKNGRYPIRKMKSGKTKIPCGVFPGQGPDGVQEHFDQHADNGKDNGEKQAVGKAEYFQAPVPGKEFGPNHPGDREHEADFDVQPDQEQEGGFTRCAPGRGRTG